jgi:hypothetical protein
MLKKIGHALLMVVLSPFMLVAGLGLAFFGFMGWAGEDVKNRTPRFLWVVFVAPGLLGWILTIAQVGYDWQPDRWLGWAIRVSYGLVAMYALFSLDRAEEILRRQFPTLTKTQEKWAMYALIAINLPVIFTVIGGFTSQYE